MKTPHQILALLTIACVSPASALVLVNDNFNNGAFGTVGGGDIGTGHTVWNGGDKNIVETTSAAWTQGTNGGWIRSELQSHDEINGLNLLTVQGYSSLSYSWTIQNARAVRATSNTGTDAPYRIQLGILPSTVAQGNGNEMWTNTAGGMWFDMTVNVGGVIGFNIHDANDTKAASSDGPVRGNGAVNGWDGVAPRTFTITLDSAGYQWSDNAGNNFGGGTYAAAGLDTELANNWWGFIMGQNRDTIGTGTHELINFKVEAVPEPTSLALLAGGAGLLLRRRRR